MNKITLPYVFFNNISRISILLNADHSKNEKIA